MKERADYHHLLSISVPPLPACQKLENKHTSRWVIWSKILAWIHTLLCLCLQWKLVIGNNWDWKKADGVSIQVNLFVRASFENWGGAKIYSWAEINVCLGKNELSLMAEHKSVASGETETAPLFWESSDTKYKDRIWGIHGTPFQNKGIRKSKEVFLTICRGTHGVFLGQEKWVTKSTSIFMGTPLFSHEHYNCWKNDRIHKKKLPSPQNGVEQSHDRLQNDIVVISLDSNFSLRHNSLKWTQNCVWLYE